MSGSSVIVALMGWGWSVLSLLGFLLPVALVVGTFVSLTRQRRDETSREVLDRRLAEGEITVEEYERIRSALRGGARRASGGAHPAG